MPFRDSNFPGFRWQFRLKHIAYACAVFGASIALCGDVGIFVAAIVLLFWCNLFYEVRKSRMSRIQAAADDTAVDEQAIRSAFTLIELLVVIALISILIAFLLPAVSSHSPHVHCRGNLYGIARALKAYELQYGSLPPACVSDAEGRPMLSWRVLILPQLGYDHLYQKFRLDEPWDSARNRKLLDQMPFELACWQSGSQQDHQTTYLAVVGERTAWPEAAARSIGTIWDDLHSTVLVVEAEARPVPWSAPEDLRIDEAIEVLSQPPSYERGHWHRGFFTSKSYGRQAVYADGFASWLRPTHREQLVQLLCVDDGLPNESADAESFLEGPQYRRAHYDNVFRLLVFVGVCLWPIVWLRQMLRALDAQARSLPMRGEQA